jgi:hypothetical protein
MGVLFPSAAIARRWDGALQAKMRRAPLEAFLRARGIVPATAGTSQDCDNVARATIWIIDEAIARYLEDHPEGLTAIQRGTIAHVCCVVGRALAESIAESGAWRIAALVSTAVLLGPRIGIKAAALASASTVRDYQRGLVNPASLIDERICQMAAAALLSDRPRAMAEVSSSIAAHLNCSSQRLEHASMGAQASPS